MSGKTTTLRAAYDYSQNNKMQCKFLDLSRDEEDVQEFKENNGSKSYFFVDNAQLLNSNRKWLSLLMTESINCCFAFSPNILTENGNSCLSSRIAILGRIFYFTPYTSSELEQVTMPVDQCPLCLPGIVKKLDNNLHLGQVHIIAEYVQHYYTD